MSPRLTHLLDRFAGLRVLVIGEAMLDSYLSGQASDMCREAPVPVVSLTGRQDVPGGAANTAANLVELGADVTLLTVVGDDPEAETLCRALWARRVRHSSVLRWAGRRTLAKHRVMAGTQILVRFDQGDTGPIPAEAERALISRLEARFPACDAVLITDYAYGVLTPRVIAALARLQRAYRTVLVADAHHLPAYREVGLTAATPNYEEAIALVGARPLRDPAARAAQIAGYGALLLERTGAAMVAVTIDREGALFLEPETPPYRTCARPASLPHVSDAGNTFAGVLTLALAAGAATPDAAELASAAAALVVARPGTKACTAAELRAALSGQEKLPGDVAALLPLVERARQAGRRIVFTNGCFDILHRDHITYLSHAKALGDLLIVGVNSDASVRRLKGEGRPINPQDDRMSVLATLSCVDYVLLCDELMLENLIRAIRPDVFVKGGDYTRETLPEAPLVEELGGRVEILPYLADRSTTQMIGRVTSGVADMGA
jgi:D-beta-D-heptose 7-phosphate kinase/D-beta-D-heptose 1-phosphate adenosyltransferase